MYTSPQPNRPRESPSLVIRFGTVAGVGTAGALACSVPAALRLLPVLGEAESAGHVWLALASAAILPMMAAVLVLGLAREGSRAFGGEGAAFAYGVSMWLVLLVVGLSVFGRLLRAARPITTPSRGSPSLSAGWRWPWERRWSAPGS